jgi:hypothetical protein
MTVVALTLFILWIFSLWLFVVEQRRPNGLIFLESLALTSGMLLFFILSVASLLFLCLLFAN